MKKQTQKQTKIRMIHIRVPEEVHKRLRIHVAEKDVTIQDWVKEIIEKELNQRNTESVGR